MINKITSFTHHVTGEGDRLSATYSVISENGELIKSNVRFNTIVVDENIKENIDAINNFLLSKIPE